LTKYSLQLAQMDGQNELVWVTGYKARSCTHTYTRYHKFIIGVF